MCDYHNVYGGESCWYFLSAFVCSAGAKNCGAQLLNAQSLKLRSTIIKILKNLMAGPLLFIIKFIGVYISKKNMHINEKNRPLILAIG